MNGVYLRALPTFDLAERLIAYLGERGSPLAAQPERVAEVTPLAQEKIATLAEFEPLCSFLFGPIEIEAEAWERVAGHDRAAEILATVQAALAACEWTVEEIEATLRAVCEQLELKPRVVFGLDARGGDRQSISPGLFESVDLLGRDEALARLPRRPHASASGPSSGARRRAGDDRRERMRAGGEPAALARGERADGRSVRERQGGRSARGRRAARRASRSRAGPRGPRPAGRARGCARDRHASDRACGPPRRPARALRRLPARHSARSGRGAGEASRNSRTLRRGMRISAMAADAYLVWRNRDPHGRADAARRRLAGLALDQHLASRCPRSSPAPTNARSSCRRRAGRPARSAIGP